MLLKSFQSTSEIAQALRAFAGAFRTVGVFSAVINLLMLVPSLYMLQVYDRVLPSRNELTLLMLTVIMLGAYLLMSALEFVRSFVLVRIGAQLDLQLNRRIYTAAFERNLARGGADAGQALADLTNIRQFLTGNALFAFFDAPWFPVYLIVIFLFEPSLGLFALAGSLLLVLLAWVNEVVSKKPLAEANTMAIASGTLATSNLRNAEVIEAMGMLPRLQARWFALHGRFLQLQAEASEKAGIVGAVTKFIRVSLQSLVLGYGALLAVEGKITPGMMIAASILMGKALSPVEQVIGVWKTWSGTRSAYQRLTALLTAHPQRAPGMALPRPSGQLAVENITAMPPGSETPVIKQLSFAIAPGDVLGIVGPSGCGKSTLARLLVGILPPQSGHVRLDGGDLHRWNKELLGPCIGYLPQDVSLFAGTIAENIARFAEPDAQQVVEAATRAGVHDMILRLPQGYDTRLAEGGGGLSGGQRQRIGLARALYGDPVLVVLDEPNSNLDDSGEQALLAAIASLRQQGRTVVIVSHRTSVIGSTTHLLLMQDNGAGLFGPTAEVLAAIRQAAQPVAAAPVAPAAPVNVKPNYGPARTGQVQ